MNKLHCALIGFGEEVVSEERARESTFDDFIDPELQDMQCIIASLGDLSEF